MFPSRKIAASGNTLRPLKPIIFMGYMNTLFEADPTSLTGKFKLRDDWGSESSKLNIRHVILTDCTAQHIAVGQMEAALAQAGVSLIPVVSENVDFGAVLRELRGPPSSNPDPVLQRRIVYCTAYLGVTGRTDVQGGTAGSSGDEKYAAGMERFRAEGHFILVGFGITTGRDINAIRGRYCGMPNACVVGTAYIRGLMKLGGATGESFRAGVCDIVRGIYTGFESGLRVKSVSPKQRDSGSYDVFDDGEDTKPPVLLKVCGYTTKAQVVAGLVDGVDLFGFNFYKPSSRYCLAGPAGSVDDVLFGDHVMGSEGAATAAELIRNARYYEASYAPLSVGVFVIGEDHGSKLDEELETVLMRLRAVARTGSSSEEGLDLVQLHMTWEFFVNDKLMARVKQFFARYLVHYKYFVAVACEVEQFFWNP